MDAHKRTSSSIKTANKRSNADEENQLRGNVEFEKHEETVTGDWQKEWQDILLLLFLYVLQGLICSSFLVRVTVTRLYIEIIGKLSNSLTPYISKINLLNQRSHKSYSLGKSSGSTSR